MYNYKNYTIYYKIKYYKVDNLNEATEQFYVKSNFANFSIKIYEIKGPIILVPKRGGAIYTNKVRIEKEACLFDSNIMGLTTNNNVRFMAYVLYGRGLSDIGDVTTIPQINKKHIDVLKIPVPSINEQEVIVEYLDTKCSEIDATTEDIQKEISLLEDYKKSVITEAVTKGLNPDAEMKDSGIAWIGEIPKDWDLLKIGYVTKEISDIDHYMPSDSDDIDKVPYLMIGDLKENISQIDFESCKYISKKVYRALSIKSKPEKGNVIFARYATIGTVCFVDSEKQLLVSYACLTVKANELIKGRFLFYYFKSNAFLEEVSQYVKSNTQGNIGKESLIRAKIVVPKLKEQTQIISYLDSKCSEIDAIIADKKRQRGILAEYKKSLIYEYVTGKKEVPINE